MLERDYTALKFWAYMVSLKIISLTFSSLTATGLNLERFRNCGKLAVNFKPHLCVAVGVLWVADVPDVQNAAT